MDETALAQHWRAKHEYYDRYPLPYCEECDRWFEHGNSAQQHEKTHRSRDKVCPMCEQRSYGSVADVALHIESGFCSACRGKSNARQVVYDFMQGHRETRAFLKPAICDWASDGSEEEVPEYPYRCDACQRDFKTMGALLQHRDAKHAGASSARKALGW